MAERGLSVEDMKNVVSYPDKTEKKGPGENGGIVWQFMKDVKGKKMVVIAEIKNSDCNFITSYYD